MPATDPTLSEALTAVADQAEMAIRWPAGALPGWWRREVEDPLRTLARRAADMQRELDTLREDKDAAIQAAAIYANDDPEAKKALEWYLWNSTPFPLETFAECIVRAIRALSEGGAAT